MSRINLKSCFSSKDTKVLVRHLYYYLVKDKGFKINLHFTNSNLRPRGYQKQNKQVKNTVLTIYSINRHHQYFCYQVNVHQLLDHLCDQDKIYLVKKCNY